MQKLIITGIIFLFLASINLISAQEQKKEQERGTETAIPAIHESSMYDRSYYVPTFKNFKYSFLNHKYSPVIGLQHGKTVDLSQNILKANLSSFIGMNIEQVSVTIGLDIHYNAFGYIRSNINRYSRIGILFTF